MACLSLRLLRSLLRCELKLSWLIHLHLQLQLLLLLLVLLLRGGLLHETATSSC